MSLNRRHFFRAIPAAPTLAATALMAPRVQAEPVQFVLVRPGDPLSAASFNKILLSIQDALNRTLEAKR